MIKAIFLTLLLAYGLGALPFDLYKMQGEESNHTHTILLVGGIHGNEPGSYFAPSVLVQNYTITQGSLWVIPALNSPSIVKNARGIYGDMNRKFKTLRSSDKDFAKVTAVQKLILNPFVDMVLNLHDGHGFYREKWKTSLQNPKAWGQSSVIDQSNLPTNSKFSNLYEIAKIVNAKVNKNIEAKHHYFSVKNTNTKAQNKEQQNSLTYFSIVNNKPSFAIETSKHIKELSLKVLYQLRTIEAYMAVANIKFERNFELTQDAVEKILLQFGAVSINDSITLHLEDIKSYVGFFPLQKKGNRLLFAHPLGAYSYSRGLYHLHIGNKHITSLKPDYFAIEHYEPLISAEVDGKRRNITLGEYIQVSDSFQINPPKNIRVNIIGYGNRSDGYKKVSKKSIQNKFAINKKETSFRVEFYKKNKFLGMAIMQFQ